MISKTAIGKSFMLLILTITITCCNQKSKSSKSTTSPPNIIFIMADDLGYADVGFNGSKYFETPALDALATSSLVFTNSYMYPTCSPTRAALLTGKQSFRTGVYTVPVLEKGTAEENIFSRWTIGKEHTIYAEPMAEVGYRSIHLGKWHIVGPYPQEELSKKYPLQEKLTQPDPGDYSWVENHKSTEVQPYYPEGRGFLSNVGGTFRGDPAFEEGGYKSSTGGYWAPFSNPFVEPKENDGWLTDRMTDDAIAFIEENKAGPVFVNLHYYAVHRPIKIRSDALHQKYLSKDRDPQTGQGIGKQKKWTAKYATVVESLDDNISKLVDYLDRSGLRENTIIIFTSDNGHHGMMSCNNNLRGSKGHIYEGGIRVPTFINWPQKINLRRSDVAVGVLDYFPTLLDLAGVEQYGGKLDGQSMTELFASDTDHFRDRAMFWHLASQWKHGTCSVIRKDHFKLIQFLADGKIELYNLRTDQKESENLAESQPEKVAELLRELVDWRKTNNVPLPPNAAMKI